MQTAARVGRMFAMDPALVLAETDELLWAVRVAAYNLVIEDINKQNGPAPK